MSNTATVDQAAISKFLAQLGVEDPAAVLVGSVRIESAKEQLTAAQATARELRKKLIALLPECTAEQFVLVLAAAKSETELAKGGQTNIDFKLTAAQQAEVKKVREERIAYLTANKDRYVRPLLEDVAQHLVSLKVRVGKGKTSTSCRFEKAAAVAAAAK